MTRRKIIFTAIIIGVIIIGILAIAAVRWVSDPARQLTHLFEGPASFSVRYPEGWQYYIPKMGVLVIAEPETLGGNYGPSFSIERSSALMMEGSLSNVLEAYLASGPERQEDRWIRQGDFTALTLAGGRDALVVDLVGHEYDGDPEMHVRLIVTKANNMVVYVISVNAPPDTWEANAPLLMRMVESITFVE